MGPVRVVRRPGRLHNLQAADNQSGYDCSLFQNEQSPDKVDDDSSYTENEGRFPAKVSEECTADRRSLYSIVSICTV
jgi:hypothetical protein